VLGGDSEVLDSAAPDARLPPHNAARLALHYRGCAVPGCTRPPDWCDAHHVIHWSAGGRTDLDNLLPLCQHHHTTVHHHGWHIARAADGEFDFIHPPASTHSNDPADNPTSADKHGTTRRRRRAHEPRRRTQGCPK
jgi:hypothetical protein